MVFTSQNSRAPPKDRIGVYQHLRVMNIFPAHPLGFGRFTDPRPAALRGLFCLIRVRKGEKIEKSEHEWAKVSVPDKLVVRSAPRSSDT